MLASSRVSTRTKKSRRTCVTELSASVSVKGNVGTVTKVRCQWHLRDRRWAHNSTTLNASQGGVTGISYTYVRPKTTESGLSGRFVLDAMSDGFVSD